MLLTGILLYLWCGSNAIYTRPKDSETHFKVVVVSHEFDSVPSLVARHRLINSAVSDLLTTGGGSIHAFSIVAKTPLQWTDMATKQGLVEGSDSNALNSNQVQVEASPNCRGGDGSLPSRK
jgi:BolA-like protein 1